MHKVLTAVLLIVGLSAMIAPSSARAEIEYPWCARYNGKFAGTSCGFTSRGQCLATVSGAGGSCMPNPSYRGRAIRAPRGEPFDLGRLGIDDQLPWCALMSGREGGAGTNCGYLNRRQCMATISGAGGTCFENPAYVPRVDRPARWRARHKR